MKIRLLSETTINQIAAGEVVENPSSVAKELIENALDAGSSEVTIRFQGAGRQLLSVSDDGCGMTQEEALLSLERHATSKIQDVNDLESISTMGFRGEAIPSIASVSKFRLTTCVESGTACRIEVAGGSVVSIDPAASPRGTTIEVRSLFYNVPVRQKFQKSLQRDTQDLLKLVRNFALSRPDITFRLYNGEEEVIAAPAWRGEFLEGLKNRIGDLLGHEIVDGMVPLTYDKDGVSVRGFVSQPMVTRASRVGQHLFLNHRVVVSPIVGQAVLEGYGTRIPSGRFPLFVLHLELGGIDVNVHPQKREVRFENEDLVRRVVTEAVSCAFQTSEPVPIPEVSFPWEAEPPPVAREEAVLYRVPDTPVGATLEQPVLVRPSVSITALVGPYIFVDGRTVPPAFQQDAASLYIIHARTAMEQIAYEEAMNNEVTADSQPLLTPLTIDLLPHESASLASHIDLLKGMGIEIESFGGQSFLIHALPPYLSEARGRQVIADLAHQLDSGGVKVAQQEEAKKVAIAIGRASSKEELSLGSARRLVERLFECQSGLHSPSGKRIIAAVSEKEFGKKLGFEE